MTGDDLMPRVLSGIQPTGNPHLGNYFGAIKQHLELQEKYDAFYFIADYHALTTVKDPEALHRATREVAAIYFALGLNPDKATFFRQSDVPEVHELTWLLECVTGMGVLQRSHAYKDKIANGITPNVGLFCYPALMASDILIYKSEIIPVGSDQAQHVEICQAMAQSFNHAYNTNLFKIPKVRLSETPKIPGTDGRKMSKSYNNTIPIFATGKELKRAISSIVTDSKDPKKVALDPLTCNAFAIFQLFSSTEEAKDLAEQYRKAPVLGFLGYGVTKAKIRDAIEDYFGPMRKEYDKLLKPGSRLDDVLVVGASLAGAEAQATLAQAREIVGLGCMRARRY